MADDVLLNKAAIIERCLQRIHEEYSGHESALETDYTRQDAIVLNLQRACEAAIDLAMHVSALDCHKTLVRRLLCWKKLALLRPISLRACVPWSVFATSPCTSTAN